MYVDAQELVFVDVFVDDCVLWFCVVLCVYMLLSGMHVRVWTCIILCICMIYFLGC